MPINSESINRKLFDLLSTRGFDPKPLDVEGKVTPVPEEAAVIKFDFIKDGKNYGKVWVSIDSARSLQIYYGDSVSNSPDDATKDVGYDDTWTGLLKHLKNWAQRRQLGFDLRNENHLASDMARRNYSENVSEGTIRSDMKPKLSGLSLRDLDLLSESAGNDYYLFNENVSKNLNLPKYKGVSSNTLNLYSVYFKQKLKESNTKDLSNVEKALFNTFSKRVKSSIESVNMGDSVSLLSLSTLAVPDDKVFARLQGFLSPKEVKSISRSNNIDYLHFVDGSKFPDTDNDDPIYLAQSWVMTKLFDSYDSALKAYTIYALIGDELSDNIQFNVDVDTKKEKLDEKKVSEIGFSNALGKLSIPDAEIIDNSTVVGTIGSRKVSLFKQGNNKIYFFTNNDKSKLDALLYLMDDNLLGMKNFSENSGLIYNLFQYLINIEGQKLTIKSVDKLTPDGINWIIKQIKNPQSFNIKDQNGEKIDPKKLFQEWEKARKTHNPGPTGIVIGEGRNSIQLKENENRLMPMDIFGATLKFKKDMGSLMPVNFYNTPRPQKKENDMKQVNEGYYAMGKQASYSDAVPTTKIIIQHTRKIEEGEQRYRNIAKIFVENMNGERFLIPTTKPGIARVYARHISEGGTPYDERGKHITGLVEEYQKMAGFVRATKNKQFNESAQELINEGVNHYQSLRETLHKMCGRRGYTAYFESWQPTLIEDGEEQSNLNELFVQETLDPRIASVMPILSRLHKKTPEVNETLELAEWADEIVNEKLEITETAGLPLEVRKLYTQTYAKFAKTAGAAKGARQMAYAIVEKKYGKEMADKLKAYHDQNSKLDETEVEESGLQAYLGNKKYGKAGMDALRKAGREGASKEKMASIRAKYDKLDEEDVAEAGYPGAPDVEMPPMKPSGDPERDKLKQEYVNIYREIKSLVDIPYRSDSSPEQKMQAKARIKQLNDRADQIKAILEPRQPPNEWQKKTYGIDDNWNTMKEGVAEGYWQDALKKAESDREARKGKPFEKNPLSHDEKGVYVGDKDLAGNPVPRDKKSVEEGNNSSSYDNIADLKSKSNKELDDLVKFWQNALEKNPNHKVANDQLHIIKMLRAERVGKKGVKEGSDVSGLLAASHLNKSFIITAELAEGGKKKFRVKAQSERVAKEKFMKHHAMAKILDVKEEGISESKKKH
jgi:hypothetical protein